MNWRRVILAAGLLLASAWGCLAGPIWAQLPGEEQELDPAATIVRLAVAEVAVQGEYESEAVKTALTAVLPQLAACLPGAADLRGRLPAKITVRFNLGSSGKVVWLKLIEPAGKKLEECFSRSLAALRLPPTGAGLSRVTVVLECRSDHLLTP
jgi:hypothetical protein